MYSTGENPLLLAEENALIGAKHVLWIMRSKIWWGQRTLITPSTSSGNNAHSGKEIAQTRIMCSFLYGTDSERII